jgi:hypothetical protein
VLFFHVPASDVVQPAVVRLADDRIDRFDAFVLREAEDVVENGIGCRGYAQRVGEDDGRFEVAQFLDLCRAHELPETVGDVNGGRDFFLKDVAVVRQDGRDARSDILAFDESQVVLRPNSRSRGRPSGERWAGPTRKRNNAQKATVFIKLLALFIKL